MQKEVLENLTHKGPLKDREKKQEVTTLKHWSECVAKEW